MLDSNYMIIVIVLLFLFGCSEKPGANQKLSRGIIQGQVIVGPLRPIQRLNDTIPAVPKTYRNRKILIVRKGEPSPVAETSIDAHGNFKITLPSGDYLINMKLQGMEHSDDLPEEVNLHPVETVHLTVHIDTGMR